MNEYVLVIEEKRGLRIGKKKYSKEGALKRLKAVEAVGIKCMKIMRYEVATGVQK